MPQSQMPVEPLAADPMFADDPGGGGGFDVPEAIPADNPGGKKKLIILIAAIVAGVAVLGGGGYFAYTTFFAKQDDPASAVRKPKPVTKSVATTEAPGKAAPEARKAARRPSVPVRTPRRGTYGVQVGAYAVKSNVNAPAADLRGAGYKPYIVEKRQHVTLFEVVVGKGGTKEEATRMAKGLKAMGYRPKLKGKNGQYTVLAITHPKKSLAEATVARLKKKNFSPVRISRRAGVRILNQLRVGEYRTAREADTVVARLKRTGMPAARVRN